MNETILIAKTEIKNCKNTGDIRKLSSRLFRSVKDKTIDNIFSICSELLEEYMLCIAFDFAHRMKNQYDEYTFALFEKWLEKYVRGWGDCDDFCVHAFGELICQKPELVSNIIAWTQREEFWMRRASAVVLLVSIKHDKYKYINPLQISDLLMKDEHYLVQKGYGWMLKELSIKEPELVFEYLLKNKTMMPGLSYRYALQKMNSDKKKILLQ